MPRIVYPTLSPLMRLLRSRVNEWFSEFPQPADSPHIHLDGPDADRLLLFGSGPAVGYGVLSNELALPGHLARQLAAISGRGVELDVVADPDLAAEGSVEALTALKLWRYDAILLTVGLNNALLLTPVPVWQSAMRDVLGYVAEHVPRRTRVLVVAIPPIAVIDSFTRLSSWVANRHAARLNRETRRLAANVEHVTFVPFSPLATADDLRYRSAETYEHWARLMVSPLSKQLAEERREEGALDDGADS